MLNEKYIMEKFFQTLENSKVFTVLLIFLFTMTPISFIIIIKDIRQWFFGTIDANAEGKDSSKLKMGMLLCLVGTGVLVGVIMTDLIINDLIISHMAYIAPISIICLGMGVGIKDIYSIIKK